MDVQVINIDKDILGGTAVFHGTRVPIKHLFDYLETGESIDAFLADFDGVTRIQVVRLLDMSQKLIESSTSILNENTIGWMHHQAVQSIFARIWSLYCSAFGLTGVKNGQLMTFCSENGFDILLTIDKNLMFQQNLSKYSVSIVVLNARSSKLEELILFVDSFNAIVPEIKDRQVFLLEVKR